MSHLAIHDSSVTPLYVEEPEELEPIHASGSIIPKFPPSLSRRRPLSLKHSTTPPTKARTHSQLKASTLDKRQRQAESSLNRAITQPRIARIKLHVDVTDADKRNWITTRTKCSDVPNKPGVFRIDDIEANVECSPVEQERRQQVLKELLMKLGTALYEARLARRKKLKVQVQVRVQNDDEKLVSLSSTFRASNLGEEGGKKKRRSHRQIPKQTGADIKRFILQALPPNYTIVQARRPHEGIKTADAIDTYIVGSASGVFNSIDSFIPHLDWIDQGMPSDPGCTCKLCKHPFDDSSQWRSPVSPTETTRSRRRAWSQSSESTVADASDDEPSPVTPNPGPVRLPLIQDQNQNASTSQHRPRKRRWSDSLTPRYVPTLIPLGKGRIVERQELLYKTSYSVKLRTPFNSPI